MALAVFFLLIAMLFTEFALVGLVEAAYVAVPSFIVSAGLLFRLWMSRTADSSSRQSTRAHLV
ncbi:MAG: hypothetical protein ACR2H3_10130 [Acidimicrobiales bacterium]